MTPDEIRELNQAPHRKWIVKINDNRYGPLGATAAHLLFKNAKLDGHYVQLLELGADGSAVIRRQHGGA